MLAPSRPATPGNAPPPVAADPMPTTNQPAAITAQPRGLRRLPSTTVFSPNCIDSMLGSLALVRSWPPYRVTRLLSGGYQPPPAPPPLLVPPPNPPSSHPGC